MNNPVSLEPSRLELSEIFFIKIQRKSKIVLYGYIYYYIHKNRHIKITYIKIDIYKDLAEDGETRFDTSSYELDRSCS